MSDALGTGQELRSIALREANYYFGFTAQLKRATDLHEGAPVVRVRDLLAMAEVFEAYLRDGTLPDVSGG